MENKQFDTNDVTIQDTSVDVADPLREGVKLIAIRKKNLRRFVVSAISLTVVTVVIFSARSLAYFTDNISSNNNLIASGNVDVDLIEMTNDSNGGLTTQTSPIKVFPASTVSKVVTVKNAGSLPVYIRIKLDKTIGDETGLPTDWKEEISCNINLTDWTQKDGYYYYNHALKAGESTNPLFSEVSFAASMGNEFVNKTVQFSVTAQATQVHGNGSNVFDAAGWPAEQ